MKRPLFWVGSIVISMMAVTTLFINELTLPLGLALAIFIFILSRAKNIKCLVLFLAVALIASSRSATVYELETENQKNFINKPSDVVMTVTSSVDRMSTTTISGKAYIKDDNSNKITRDATFTLYGERSIAVGSVISFIATPQIKESQEHISDFTLHGVEEIVYIDEHPHLVLETVTKANNFILEKISDYFSGDVLAVAQALMLGEKKDLSYSLNSSFSASGLSHLVVVSGLHLAIVISTMGILLAKMGKKKKVLISMIVCWLFVLITGFGPSAIRAGIMISVIELSHLAKRKADTLSSLGLAVIVMCFAKPEWAASYSLWMTVLAVVGISLIAQPLNEFLQLHLPKRLAGLKGIINSFTVSVGAQLGVAPALIIMLGSVSVWGLVANIPAVFLISILLPLLWVTFIISLVFPPLVVILAKMCEILVDALIWIATTFAELPYNTIYLNESFEFLWVGIFYLVLIALLAYKCKIIVFIRACLLMMVVLFLLQAVFEVKNKDKVEILLTCDFSVGVVVDGNTAILLGGPEDMQGHSEISGALERLSVSNIECIILTEEDIVTDSLLRLCEDFSYPAIISSNFEQVRGMLNRGFKSVYKMPEEEFYPLGIRTNANNREIEVYFKSEVLLKNSDICDILSEEVFNALYSDKEIQRYRVRREDSAT